jgi:hypothetical protein
MKKPLLTLLFLAGSTLATQAQTRPVHFGLKAGVNFSKFVGTDVVNDYLISTLYRTGLSGGVLAEVALSEHLALQPEALYTSKGNKEIFASTVTAYQSLGYLDIPVLLKYKIPHFFVEAGPQLGVLLHAKRTLESAATTQEIDNKSTYRSTDLGYALGLGVQDTNGLLLGVRYNGGLTNVPNADPQPHVRNNTFHIYVGYVFNNSK